MGGQRRGGKVRRRGGDAAGGKAALFKRAINQPFQKQQHVILNFTLKVASFPPRSHRHTHEGEPHMHTADLFVETKQGLITMIKSSRLGVIVV